MIMAGLKWVGAAALMAAAATPAASQELSEKSVQVFMDYAWSLVPQQYSKKDGTVIVVDKAKRDDVMVPLDIAREIIRVGRISAHAQVCNLPEDQALNYRSMMRRETDKKKWTDQQTLYLSQLHLTTVMLLTGKIKLVEKDGDKEVVVDEKNATAQTCTDEQRAKVKEMIASYVKAGPALAAADVPVQSPPPAGAAPAAAPAASASASPAPPAAKK
jgi:hypothetical protein